MSVAVILTAVTLIERSHVLQKLMYFAINIVLSPSFMIYMKFLFIFTALISAPMTCTRSSSKKFTSSLN